MGGLKKKDEWSDRWRFRYQAGEQTGIGDLALFLDLGFVLFAETAFQEVFDFLMRLAMPFIIFSAQARISLSIYQRSVF